MLELFPRAGASHASEEQAEAGEAEDVVEARAIETSARG